MNITSRRQNRKKLLILVKNYYISALKLKSDVIIVGCARTILSC